MRGVLPVVAFFYCVTTANALDPFTQTNQPAGAVTQAVNKENSLPWGDWFRVVDPAEREAIFAAIWATADMQVFSEPISRWKLLRGQGLYEDLEPARAVCCYALLSRFCPMELGPGGFLAALSPVVDRFRLVDLLALAYWPLEDEELIGAVEDSFGTLAGYGIRLPESPELVENLERLSRLPWLAGLMILMKDPQHPDERLLAALRKLRVVGHAELCDLQGRSPEFEAVLRDLDYENTDAR
jgi:hypothetical protein